MGAITEATDKELEDYRRAIVAEQERRRTLSQATAQLEAMNRSVLAALGIVEGGEWVQPTDATNAFPKDWVATHEGATWVSTVSANVWEPGVSGWRKQTSEGSVPEFLQPTGQHDSYQTGEHVMFEGAEYVSTIDNNVWSPAAYPDGWERA